MADGLVTSEVSRNVAASSWVVPTFLIELKYIVWYCSIYTMFLERRVIDKSG
jgi:hypothetical protein